MRLTIRAIIKWEQLNQKPFSSMDYNDENDIVSLFYVCELSDKTGMSLSEFEENLSDESLKKMVKEFEKQIRVDSQFQPVSRKRSSKKIEGSKDSQPVYIKDLVPMLVIGGLDVHFALDEMSLYDIPIYLKAHEERMQHRLESSRLWTYIQAFPNLSRKIKSPKDMHPFSWEIEEEKEFSKEELEKGISKFNSFIKSGK